MNTRTTFFRVILASITLFAASAGAMEACPFCNSPTPREVRAGLFAKGSGKTIAVMIAPFAVLLLGLRIYCAGIDHSFQVVKNDIPSS